MTIMVIIAMAVFTILIFSMSMTVGTKGSISALAEEWRWLLLVALWSQILLLPQMLEMTPHNLLWIPFLGVGGIIICGGASIFKKEDELIHMMAAALTFACFTSWVMFINSPCLIALVLCAAAGRDRFKWRVEIGLIISVYLTVLLYIN